MLSSLKSRIAKELRNVADRLDSGTCEISQQEAMEIVSMLTHQVMSKESSCIYLNISRSKFDEYIREGKIPKGRKRVGFKELIWFRDELDLCKNK